MGEKANEINIHEHSAQEKHHEGHPDTERLRAEIERTRREMGLTLDEIKAQLAPSRLREQAKARMKEASVGRARRAARGANTQVRSTIKEHPLMSAVMGLSAFWLLKEGIQSAREEKEFREFERAPEREYLESEPLAESLAEEPGLRGAYRERAEGRLESARERAGQVGEEVRERAGEFGRKAKGKVSHYAGRGRETTSQQKEKVKSAFSRMLEERPLVLTTAAVALGAVIASLIPESRKERELMGERKEKVTGKLKEQAQESFEKAKTVAKDTAEFAKEEAKGKM
jgi:hypothetical protein